jgi:hypothetical protein
MTKFPFIGEVDMSKLVFLPQKATKNGQKIVEICRDATSTTNNKLLFSLCPDPRLPYDCRFRLDSVREDSNEPNPGARRGLVVYIQDEAALAALQKLDEMAIDVAFENRKEWFKNGDKMERNEVRNRYKHLVFYAKEEDKQLSCKFKVKCPPSAVPTKLLRLREDNVIVENGASIDDISLPGAKVAATISIYSMWFMAGGASFGISMQAEDLAIVPGSAKIQNHFATKRELDEISYEQSDKVPKLDPENEVDDDDSPM